MFSLNAVSGEIIQASVLDFEDVDTYILEVTVTDGVFFAEAIVTINVEDVADMTVTSVNGTGLTTGGVGSIVIVGTNFGKKTATDLPVSPVYIYLTHHASRICDVLYQFYSP